MKSGLREVDGRPESDEILMRRYAAGDVEAFERLFERYEPRAYAFFLKRTGSPERSRDLYQDLFLRIHRARDRYDATQPFTPWFFQIAVRLLVDDRRRAFRGHEVPIREDDSRSAEPSSERELADREHVERLLDVLSPEERYVVLASKVEGIGYSELASQLGRSSDAVKKMASRAIKRLRSSKLADEVDGISVA